MIAAKPVILPRTTVTAGAVAHLREEIIQGHLRPGEALPEAKVGALLGVSRAPVREALTLLEREGLVTFDRRGTARVCVFGRNDVRELALMRLSLEPVAARLACERITAERLAQIEENLRALRQSKTLADVTRLDVEFHRLILRAAGNRRLLGAWDSLAAQFRLVITRLHQAVEQRTRQVRESTHRSHSELFAGLNSRDPARAEALAREAAARWFSEMEDYGVFNESGEDAR